MVRLCRLLEYDYGSAEIHVRREINQSKSISNLLFSQQRAARRVSVTSASMLHYSIHSA